MCARHIRGEWVYCAAEVRENERNGRQTSEKRMDARGVRALARRANRVAAATAEAYVRSFSMEQHVALVTLADHRQRPLCRQRRPRYPNRNLPKMYASCSLRSDDGKTRTVGGFERLSYICHLSFSNDQPSDVLSLLWSNCNTPGSSERTVLVTSAPRASLLIHWTL